MEVISDKSVTDCLKYVVYREENIMPVTTSYPGVYVDESSSVSLSVNSLATSVPAIITYGMPRGPVIRFNNYLEYQAYASKGGITYPDVANMRFRAYFEMGGGYCYSVDKNHANAIASYPDINLIVGAGFLPDADPEISSFWALCNPGSGLFGLMDVKNEPITDGTAMDSCTSNPCVAAYYPYLNTSWYTGIPPSVVMAGLYCKNDVARGVWKAPANMVLPAGYEPSFKISDVLQGQYTSGKALNMIRTMPGRGVVVWGARTLEDSDNWRYIPVRRLFDSIERDINSAIRSMVFEPNTAPTWEKIRTAITNYLHNLWRQGALLGVTEKDAYYVQIGRNVTMTDDDIAQGRMIAKVGVAAVRPAEFIVLQFTQNVEQQ